MKPSVFSWSAIISAHVKLGDNVQAIGLYKQMLEASVEPDGHVFVDVLKACSSATTLEHGQQIHAHIIQCGLESDAFVGSSLLDLYVKCGNLRDAQLVFDRLHKQDVVTWSTLLLGYIHHGHGKEALELFDQMQQDKTEPDQVTFVCLLTACSTIGGLEQGRRIHNYIIAYGVLINSYVGNALVDMYAKCSSLEDAQGVFDHLHIRNVVTWSSLISGYAQYGYDQEAFRLFDQMQQQGLQPNEVTYLGILKACPALEQGRQMHNCIIEHGFELNLLVGSALVDLYVKCGSLLDARIVFNTLTQRNVITWSTLIAGYIQHGLDEEAFQLFEKMQEQGIEPNPITFISSLKACSVLAILERGWWLHTHVIESGLESHIFVGNALIDMYAKCGSLEDACVVFQRMPDRDIVSWTTVLGMYAEDVRGLEGVQVFEQMKQDGIEPNAITYGYILKILTSVAALEQGQQIHACIVESGLELGALVGNALLDIYAKCGRLEDAFMVFERMPKKEVETWSALLMGCALHRDYSSALKIFKGMQCSGLKPDGVMFLCLLSACNFVGLLDESCLHFKAMRDEHGIIPTLEHCNSMVDILGHAGCLDEAEDLLETNPFGANVVGWTSLLNSCKIHVNVGFARRSFDRIVMLDQESSAGYVLMSKVYSHAGMLACAEEIEDMRRYRNGWKKPAHAFIEVDNRVHDFAVGDKLHPQSADIYAKLDVLSVQMKEEGYKPRLDLVLGPMSLEKKEDALCGHSEKLAIAFGLISSPHGSTIRISKNLRMCGDCHNASKFISRIEMREIIVTDTYCIHRFQDGTCSCKDYSYEIFKDETLQTLH